MTQYVTSTIRANATTYIDDLDNLKDYAARLSDAAERARSAASLWQGVEEDIDNSRRTSECTYVQQGAPSVTPPDHLALSYDALYGEFDTLTDMLTRISSTLEDTADQLIRAYSVYSSAEDTTRRVVNEILAAAIGTFPIPSMYVGGALTPLLPFLGLKRDGQFVRPDIALLRYFSWFQDGIVSGLSGFFTGSLVGKAVQKIFNGLTKFEIPKESLLFSLADPEKWKALEWSDTVKGLFTTDEANELFQTANPFVTAAGGLVQGTDLSVTEAAPSLALGKPETVAAALANAQALGEMGGEGYATLCIQQVRRPDGSRAWIVTLPDSDNHIDSPCSPSQTAELMSSSSRQRLSSDAVRFAREAMDQAGVKKGDQIVLIGASQGGLTAASLASGLSGTYEFTHVVTAGAPIANHDIPASTWVTSVEMEADPMTAMDGAQNPVRSSWLTVSGDVETKPGAGLTPVAGTGDALETPHGMEYQRAAWVNASLTGSPAVESHEAHYQDAVEGELVSTTYYQGRLSH